jgi:hypothetical protein
VIFFYGICIGLFLGGLAMAAFILSVVRWAIGKFLSDAYHKNLLPLICRIEGLLVVALLEIRLHNFSGSAFLEMYIEKALECIREHKKNVMDSLEKYHDWS